MKQVFLPLLLVAVFIIVIGVFTKNGGFGQSLPMDDQGRVLASKTEIKIADILVRVDVADSQDEREKGLSGISSLEDNEGMLFVFRQKDIYPSFWMKGMLIPIDIIWIDDGSIVKIHKNVPVPPSDIQDSNLPLYYPERPIDYVLEVKAGFSDKNNVDIGDSVDLSSI